MTERTMIETCEQYREAVGGDPAFDGGAQHLVGCAECRAYRDEMLALDARIAKALAVPVPALDLPELPDIDAANVTPLRARKPSRVWYAMAASVLVAALIGFRILGSNPVATTTLADEVLAHLDHEMFSMRVSTDGVSEARLARVVPANIAQLDPADGLVTYAQSCVINGHAVPHLVIQGRNGPVTVLLMPHEKVDGPQSFSDGELGGVILPVGNGSIAIVGHDPDDLEHYQKALRNSVTWST